MQPATDLTLAGTLCLLCAAIGSAFAVLSDSQKRKRYDEYGTSDETELRQRRHPNGYEYDFSRGFEGKHNFRVVFHACAVFPSVEYLLTAVAVGCCSSCLLIFCCLGS